MRHYIIRILNLLLHRDWVFNLVGALNRRWHFLETVFVMYPATKEYANKYAPESRQNKTKWTPYLVGMFVQNGKLGLSFAVSSMEEDFKVADNLPHLRNMVEITRNIQQRLGASQISFSGILPGVLNSYRIIKGSVEAKVTVEAVVKAEEKLRATLNMDNDVPVVLLGGGGFIGKRVNRRLSQRTTYVVDPVVNMSEDEKNWYKKLKGQEIVLINLANDSALLACADHLWPEVAVMNEVYPEPDPATVKKINEVGCPIFHVVGLEAWCFPSFPKAYRGGVPCCAGRLVDELKPLITRLN